MASPIFINGVRVGAGCKPFIIGELSGNHDGDINNVFRAIDVACEAKIDAIKIQTYTADSLTLDCDKPDFWIKDGLWKRRRLYDLYQSAGTPFGWHKQIFEYARNKQVAIFSSPFDVAGVELLESLDVFAYKIASFEIAHIPLLRAVGATKKPVILSTGVATRQDIDRALEVLMCAGTKDIILLYCVSQYPAQPSLFNLNKIKELETLYDVPVGLSDHSKGIAIPVAAMAIGGALIEKHFTPIPDTKTVDGDFSATPEELAYLAVCAQQVYESMREDGCEYIDQSSTQFKRSLYYVRDVKVGSTITDDDISVIRPGYGLAPHLADEVIGKRALTNVERGDPVKLDQLDS